MGTAQHATCSAPLQIADANDELHLLLLLDDEGLDPLLKQLSEGTWTSETGEVHCAGYGTLCCPLDFGRHGERTSVLVTGRFQRLDEFYPGRFARDESEGAFFVRSMCSIL